jgi:hypothetical protein
LIHPGLSCRFIFALSAPIVRTRRRRYTLGATVDEIGVLFNPLGPPFDRHLRKEILPAGF